jgi:hypothetical protein
MRTEVQTDRAGAWAASYWDRKVSDLLSRVVDSESRADLRMFFDERAGICEFDGGLARFAAERAAFELLIERLADGLSA